MPRFRYEATDQNGVPVHGTADAEHDAALTELLATRGLKLISASELSLDALIASNGGALPRLYQLRVGEQLREALLSGLPAHEAVRSVAAEPLSHPMLGVAPWLQLVASLAFVASFTGWWLTGEGGVLAVGTGLVAIVVVPVIWLVLRGIYQLQPKRLLRMLADRLEAGQQLPANLSHAMPAELKCVMQSDISDDAKARVAADLVPCLLGSSLKSQQFVMATVGPLAMLGVMFAVMYSGLLFIVPQFKAIFEGFGVELPGITVMVVGISDIVASLGIVGWVMMIAFGCAVLIVIASGMTKGSIAQPLSRVPVFGMSFRWAMQSRVARILAAMLRNDCPYAESIKTACSGSDFNRVEALGKQMAKDLEAGEGAPTRSADLSGLPISMLFVSDGGRSDNDRRFGMAKTFQSLSEMLETATLSQGRLFSIIIQFFTLTVGAVTVGIVVLAMFVPLVKLLNDLS